MENRVLREKSRFFVLCDRGQPKLGTAPLLPRFNQYWPPCERVTGIQQSPAAGQCLAEIMCGVEPHLDIAALSLERVVENKPYRERNIL